MLAEVLYCSRVSQIEPDATARQMASQGEKKQRVTICVGDIHGHHGRLLRLWRNLETRVTPALFETCTVIFLGDYNDRGPDSRKVYDWLVGLDARHPRQKHVYLAGNHDFSFAAHIGALPRATPLPEGFRWSDTWQEMLAAEDREGWWAGEGVEDVHVQGRRWGGRIKEVISAKGRPYLGSTYDAAPTFASYGVQHGDRAGLIAAVPESHKEFLRNLSFIYEQEEEEVQGEGEEAYSKLIAVHAGLEKDLPLEPQLATLRNREVTHDRLEALSGRRNVLDIPPELEEKGTLLVSGHHGILSIKPRRLIIDESGGVDDRPIAAIILPSREIVRDTDKLEEAFNAPDAEQKGAVALA
eukprot:jgi/Mesen1/385/ME000010S_10845